MSYKIFHKKIVRIIIIIFLSIFILATGIISYFYFNASHIQNQIKKKTSTAVLKYEDDLLAVIDECKNNEEYAVLWCVSVQDSDFIFIRI